MHTGLDFSGNTGVNIYSTGDGIVIRADSEMRGYGNLVIIDHGFGYETRYAHCSAFKVKVGQKVKRGDLMLYLEIQECQQDLMFIMKFEKTETPLILFIIYSTI